MYSKCYITCVFKLFVLLAIPVGMDCQEVWTIEECIAKAIDRNIDIRKQDIDIVKGGIDTKMSEYGLLPNLETQARPSLGLGRSIDPTSNDFINSNILSLDWGLSSQVTLYNGGILKNRIAQNKVQQEILKANRDMMVSNLILDVIGVYFDVLLLRDDQSNIEGQLTLISNQIVSFEQLVQEGSRAKYELVELHAQQASTERELLLSKHRFKERMLDLKNLLSLETDVDIDVVSPNIPRLPSDLGMLSSDILTEQAINALPELKMYDLIEQRGALGIKIAEGLNKPIVRLRGSLGSSFSSGADRPTGTTSVMNESSVLINGDRVTIGEVSEIPRGFENIPYPNQLRNNLALGLRIQVVMPIFDNYNRKGTQAKAKLEQDLIRADKEKWFDAVNYQMSLYLNKAIEAEGSVKASDKLLSVRKQATDNAIKRFEHGAISTLDFLDLQERLAIAQFEYISARYQYLKIIHVLEFYQGTFYSRR